MSDMANNKRKGGSHPGLEGFILDVKKYGLLGIVLPIVLLIPSLIIQILWISYDNIVIKYGIDTSIGNGRFLDPDMLTSGERRIVRFLETIIDEPPFVRGLLWAFVTLLLILVTYQIADMLKSFFGSNSALVLAAPCSKPILFFSKFMAASVVSFLAILLSQFQWFLISGGFKWDGSSLGITSWRDLQGIEANNLTNISFEWNSVYAYFALFLFIWLGAYMILGIVGKMQRSPIKMPVIVIIGAVIAVALFLGFMFTLDMLYKPDAPYVLFVIPCTLLLVDILLVSRYDAVTV